VFRTKTDAELTKRIYRAVPVLAKEKPITNPWGLRFMTMFHMANDSALFRGEGDNLLPLYEAKMIWHFDHRYATYEGATQANINEGSLPKLTPGQKADPTCDVLPRYWVRELDVLLRLVPLSDEERAELEKLREQDQVRSLRPCAPRWLLGFRDVTNAVVERTAIFSLLPPVGIGHKAPLVFLDNAKDATHVACFLGNMNALVFDYVTRQKIGGTSLSYFILRQLPVIPPDRYSSDDLDFIGPLVLELVYTSSDMKPFAEDMGYDGDPYVWNEDRRAQIRAELDAYYARLYGLTRDELRYVLDPKEVQGEDFPSETFRVLKEKEIKQYGEYRTQRLVLKAWDKLEAAAAPAEIAVSDFTAMAYPSTNTEKVICATAIAVVQQSPGLSSMDHLDALLLATHPEWCKTFLSKRNHAALKRSILSAPTDLVLTTDQSVRWKECRDYLEQRKALSVNHRMKKQPINLGADMDSAKESFPGGVEDVVEYALQALEQIRELRKDISSVPQETLRILEIFDMQHRTYQLVA